VVFGVVNSEFKDETAVDGNQNWSLCKDRS